MNEDNIKEMFGQYGGVVAVTIVKDQLNRSKGFGFVEVRITNQSYARVCMCVYTHGRWAWLSRAGLMLWRLLGSPLLGSLLDGRVIDDVLLIPFPLPQPTNQPQMAVKEEGEAAIAQLDGKEIEGRPINVRLGTSKPQPRLRKERTQQSRGGGYEGGGGNGRGGGGGPAGGSAGSGSISSLLDEDD